MNQQGSDRYVRLVPELVVSDLDRSLTFYTEVLGFSILYERPDERFAYLDRDGAQIMIEQPVARSFIAGELEQPYGRGMNLQIEVTDVQALYAEVQAAGATVHLALEDRSYRVRNAPLVNRQFVVQDPDGYLLRFFQDVTNKRNDTPA